MKLSLDSATVAHENHIAKTIVCISRQLERRPERRRKGSAKIGLKINISGAVARGCFEFRRSFHDTGGRQCQARR